MSYALKARRQAFAQATAIAHRGGSKRIAAAIDRASELPPGPALGPREMAGLFDDEKNTESGAVYAEGDWQRGFDLAMRFTETFPGIKIGDNEPIHWLAMEVATLLAAERRRYR